MLTIEAMAEPVGLAGPCPLELRDCESSPEGVRISWETIDGDDCRCSMLEVRHEETGIVLASLDPDSREFEISCERILEATGATSGTICIVCIGPDEEETLVCCDFECPEPCKAEVVCDPTGDSIVVAWTITPSAEDCCERLEIRDRETGIVVATPGLGETFAEIPCDDLPAPEGEVCLVCIKPDGSEEVLGCCPYECEGCKAEVVCDPTGDSIVIAWTITPSAEECCERLELRDRETGVVVATPDLGETFAEIPCDDLPGAEGEVCLVCIKPDGSEEVLGCCPYECEGCKAEVVCDPTGDSIVIAWTIRPSAEECCERLELRDRETGVVVATPGLGETFAEIPCDDLPGAEGEVCLVCVKPDGSEEILGCCEYRCGCPPGSVRLRPGDVNLDGAVNIADPVALLNYLFAGGFLDDCLLDGGGVLSPAGVKILDWNGDGQVNITDAVAELGCLFAGGRPHDLGEDCVCCESTCPETCKD